MSFILRKQYNRKAFISFIRKLQRKTMAGEQPLNGPRGEFALLMIAHISQVTLLLRVH